MTYIRISSSLTGTPPICVYIEPLCAHPFVNRQNSMKICCCKTFIRMFIFCFYFQISIWTGSLRIGIFSWENPQSIKMDLSNCFKNGDEKCNSIILLI